MIEMFLQWSFKGARNIDMAAVFEKNGETEETGIALRLLNSYNGRKETVELAVKGVLKEYHRQGIGGLC